MKILIAICAAGELFLICAGCFGMGEGLARNDEQDVFRRCKAYVAQYDFKQPALEPFDLENCYDVAHRCKYSMLFVGHDEHGRICTAEP